MRFRAIGKTTSYNVWNRYWYLRSSNEAFVFQLNIQSFAGWLLYTGWFETTVIILKNIKIINILNNIKIINILIKN